MLAETKGIIISFWNNDGSKGGCWVGICARGLKGTDVVCESFEKLEEERKEAARITQYRRNRVFWGLVCSFSGESV